MVTQFRIGKNRKRAAIALVLVTAVEGVFFSSAGLTAPAVRPPPAVMESGSGMLTAYGFNVVDDVDFTYGEVRHVSLTIAYYGDDAGPADLFAGPIWGDGTRSKYIWSTNFGIVAGEDDFNYYPQSETVEFDADHWKIELRSLGNSEKYVRYMYTVTYPKP